MKKANESVRKRVLTDRFNRSEAPQNQVIIVFFFESVRLSSFRYILFLIKCIEKI